MRSVITTKKGTASSGVMSDHIRKVHPEKLAETRKGTLQSKQLYSGGASLMSYVPPKKWARTDAKSQKCDLALAGLIVNARLPFSMVDSPSFKLYTVSTGAPYTPASRRVIADSIVPKLYEESVRQLKLVLGSVDKIALSFDMWSRHSRRIAAFYAYFIRCTATLKWSIPQLKLELLVRKFYLKK